MAVQTDEAGRCTVEVVRGGSWEMLSETDSLQTAIMRARAIYALDKNQPVRVVAHLPGGMRRIYTMVAQESEGIRYDLKTGMTDFGHKMVALVGLGVAASALALIGASLGSLIAGGQSFRLLAF
jgi:hypothetical protein